MAVEHQLEQTLLDLIPQQHPFRFVDGILDIDAHHVVGTCHFPDDAFFYRGHFPGNPVTPGVILIEAMAQTGIVPQAIFLLLQQGCAPEAVRNQLMVFALVEQATFSRPVSPGERLVVNAEKIYFRRNQIKSKVRMTRKDGTVMCTALLTGKGVETNVH